ncbi:oligosaccharide flippase family protein [Tatumella terrea]|uniref:oligosaccharide flippase family protein n=1 Tax=Tatumella terrea TaxID=419007 RepID=UPI0031E03FC5
MIDKLKNSIWMVLEKIISVFGLIFVNSYVAKYVGPEIFGVMALSLLTFQFVQSISQMGSDVLILKRVSENKKSGVRLLIITLGFVFVLYMTLSIFALLFLTFQHKTNLFLVFALASLIACLFSSLDLVNSYNEALLRAKINVIANVIGLVVALVFRYFISYFKMDFRLLSIPIVLVTLIPFIIKFYLFRCEVSLKKIITYKEVKTYSSYLVISGGSVLLSFIAVALYTRINQFSVSYFIDIKASGIFSVAMTLATAWIFLPNAILSSFYPSVFGDRNNTSVNEKVSNLTVMVVIVSLFIILFFWLFSGYFINKLYGEGFSEANILIMPLSFSAMFAVLSGLMDRFIMKMNGFRFLIKKSFTLLLICIISSVILINMFGVKGAAYSVLITEFSAFTFVNYFFRNASVFRLQKQAFNPLRLYDLAKKIKQRSY